MNKVAKKSGTSTKGKVAAKPVVKAKKKYTHFFIRIRSRHPSIDPLRKAILTPLKVLYRHGSTTELDLTKYHVEINSAEAIQNSSSKLKMKNGFKANGVKTALWAPLNALTDKTTVNNDKGVAVEHLVFGDVSIQFPLVAKHIYGSRGEGNYLLKTLAEFNGWIQGKTASNYIVEKFYNYNKEYRLHVTEEGCFYTCRKMLKTDTKEEDKWYRNDSNSVWILEENEQFERPSCWKQIEQECIKALKATGLDVGACDVRVQSEKTGKGNNREAVDFIVLEVNSAPSMGDITLEKYREILPKIAAKKNAKK